MRKRAVAALLIVLAALATSGSAGPAPRLLGAPRHADASCVRFVAGETGTRHATEGDLVVHVRGWRFEDGVGAYHGLDYRSWSPHTITYLSGREWRPWRGYSARVVVEVQICPTGPSRPILA